ncbi:methyl-accepting chemotaxis protein [Halobacillus sp. B23F22_1]|uniref:methyl-accepting chemotaxis protein n=1 Tax=Halobacillus sp. B23F22_1 TaxID=3459514 RepID=UPI00373F5D26
MFYIALALNVILLITTIFFAVRYNQLKQMNENNSVEAPAYLPETAFEQTAEKELEELKQQLDVKRSALLEKGYDASEKADIVRAAMDEVGKGLVKQLSSTEESSAALQQMSSAIVDLSNRSTEISDQSTMALNLTKEGNDKIQKSVTKMESLHHTVTGTYDVVKNLGIKSQEIGSIAKVITDVSEQINLLSLNAAIEAARAGEHGKGFAVVADEVRKLAEQTKQSSDQVTAIVNGTQKETTVAVASMEKGLSESEETNQSIEEVGRLFEEILSSTQMIAENNENTSVSTEEMSAGVQQIVSSVEQVTFISQESVEMFEELTEISDDELKTMEHLLQEVQSLKKSRENNEVHIEEAEAMQSTAS